MYACAYASTERDQVQTAEEEQQIPEFVEVDAVVAGDAVDDDVGRVAEQPGPDDDDADAHHGQHRDEPEPQLLRAEDLTQPPHGGTEVRALLGGHPGAPPGPKLLRRASAPVVVRMSRSSSALGRVSMAAPGVLSAWCRASCRRSCARLPFELRVDDLGVGRTRHHEGDVAAATHDRGRVRGR